VCELFGVYVVTTLVCPQTGYEVSTFIPMELFRHVDGGVYMTHLLPGCYDFILFKPVHTGHIGLEGPEEYISKVPLNRGCVQYSTTASVVQMCEHRLCDVTDGLGEFVNHGLYILCVSL
jgi:hypothetical protein